MWTGRMSPWDRASGGGRIGWVINDGSRAKDALVQGTKGSNATTEAFLYNSLSFDVSVDLPFKSLRFFLGVDGFKSVIRKPNP